MPRAVRGVVHRVPDQPTERRNSNPCAHSAERLPDHTQPDPHPDDVTHLCAVCWAHSGPVCHPYGATDSHAKRRAYSKPVGSTNRGAHA